MRLVKIQDVLELGDGETVPSVRGRVTDIGKRHAGSNDRGEYSFQTIELDDGSAKIKAKMKDREPFPATMKGKIVLIACNDGDKGLTGVKAIDDEYKGKVSRILWVTPSAHIDLADAEQAAPQAPPPAHAPAPNGNGHAHAPAPAKPGPKAALLRLANLYLLSLDAGCYVAKQYSEKTGAEMSVEQFQACVSSLFIQANKDGLAEQVPFNAH